MDEHAGQAGHGATAHVSSGPVGGGHAVEAHGDGHDDAHDGEHGHDDMGLGPIDWTMWGAGVLGVAIGLIGGLCFALSTGRLG